MNTQTGSAGDRHERTLYWARLVILTAVTLVSAATASALYARMIEVDNQSLFHGMVLEYGKRDIPLRAGGKCFGSIHTNFEHDDEGFNWTADGTLQIRLGAQTERVELKSEAIFNSAGQLGGSFLRLSASNGRFVVSTLDVDPIRVTAKVAFAGSDERMLQGTLGGPIELAEGGKGIFSLRAPNLLEVSGIVRQFTQQPVFESLGQSVHRAANTAEPCTEIDGAFDLTPVIDIVSRMGGS